MSAGEPIMNVSKRLGHADPSITLKVYSHVLEGGDQGAADRYDALLRGLCAHSEPDTNVVEFPQQAV